MTNAAATEEVGVWGRGEDQEAKKRKAKSENGNGKMKRCRIKRAEWRFNSQSRSDDC